MEEKSVKLWKRVVKWVSLGVMFGGIAAGSAYGMYSIVQQGFTSDVYYKNSYTFQVELINNTEYSTHEIASKTQERVDSLGMDKAVVSTLGDDYLTLTVGLDQLTDEATMYSYDSVNYITRQLIEIYGKTFFKANLEFRDMYGSKLFQYSDGQITFIQPPAAPTQEEETTTSYSTYSNYSNVEEQAIEGGSVWEGLPSYDENQVTAPQLIKPGSARVEYKNGYPIVVVEPINDHVWTQFQDMATFMKDNATTSEGAENLNGNMYSLWFGYDTLYSLIDIYDPEGLAASGGDQYLINYLYTSPQGTQSYEMKEIGQPFLIGYGTIGTSLNPWDENIPINIGLTIEECQALANQINYSTEAYYFNLVDMTYIPATTDQTTLMVVMILLGLVIAIAIFTMIWYYGLLGVVGGIAMTVFSLIPLAFISSFSLPVSGILVFGIFLITLIVVMITFATLKIIKTTIKDNISLKRSFKTSCGQAYTKSAALILLLSFVMIVMGLPAPQYVQIGMFFISLMMVFAYAIMIGLTLIISYLYLWMFNVRKTKNLTGKWNLHVGRLVSNENRDFEKLAKETVGKTSTFKNFRLVALIGISLTVVTFGLFGILSIQNGNWGNVKGTDGNYYRYDVVMVQGYDVNETPIDTDPEDPYYNQLKIDTVEENTSEIVNAFEAAGVNVDSTSVVRHDEFHSYYDVPPGDLDGTRVDEYSMYYGVTIISDTQMTLDQFNAINVNLSAIDTSNAAVIESDGTIAGITDDVPNDGINNWINGYVILENYSATEITTSGEAIMISNSATLYYNQQTLMGLFFAVLFMFIVIMIIYRWSFATSMLISVVGELLVTSSLLLLFFIPLSPAIFVSFFTLFAFSFATKIMISRSTREILKTSETKDQEAIRNAVNESVVRTSRLTLWLIIGMVTMGVVILSCFGTQMIVFLMTMIFGSLVLGLFNYTIYPYLLTKFENTRLRHKEFVLRSDMNMSKSVTNSEEEYIKGINY